MTTLRAAVFFGLASCGPPLTEPVNPPASAATIVAPPVVSSAPAGSTSSDAPAPHSSLDQPEGLVRAVFEALRREDAEAYAGLTISTDQDYAAESAARSDHPTAPTQERRARNRSRQIEEFRSFVRELAARGIAVRSMKLGAIDVSRAMRKGDAGFAEDLTFVVESGSASVRVTVDDCLLTPRGWIIVDGLKLRGP